jgi:hypothetical protein
MSIPGKRKDVLSLMIFNLLWKMSQLIPKRLFMRAGCSLLMRQWLSTAFLVKALRGLFTRSWNQPA